MGGFAVISHGSQVLCKCQETKTEEWKGDDAHMIILSSCPIVTTAPRLTDKGKHDKSLLFLNRSVFIYKVASTRANNSLNFITRQHVPTHFPFSNQEASCAKS